MLKTLKRKFILVNMVLVMIVLLVVAAASIGSAITEFESNYEEALCFELTLEQGGEHKQQFSLSDKGGRGKRATFSSRLTFSAVRMDDGTWSLQAPLVSVDDDVFQLLVERAEAEQADCGLLYDVAVAYERAGDRIAFVSVQNELLSLRQQMVVTGLILLGAAAAFFIISYFLSGWALRPAERSWRQQQQFVADASHELKTPLTVILANTDIMEKEIGTNQWLANTRKEAARMKGLVEDMLFLAKSDALRQPAPQTPVLLSDIIWESALSFEVLAYEKRIELESDIEQSLYTKGDAVQLRQLASILLDNAVKYTPADGRVYVRLRAAREKLILSVQNSGDPIPPEHLAHLFDRFYRAEESRTQEGYGLGLAIASEIAGRHHGGIDVQSDAENGTVFSVQLPRTVLKE